MNNDNYKRPLVFKNGFTPLTIFMLSMAVLWITLQVYLLGVQSVQLASSGICFILIMFSVSSYSEFRDNEVTIKRGLHPSQSEYITLNSIYKIEVGRWRLRIYFNDGDLEKSARLPGGASKEQRDEIVDLLTKGSNSLDVIENNGLLSAMT